MGRTDRTASQRRLSSCVQVVAERLFNATERFQNQFVEVQQRLDTLTKGLDSLVCASDCACADP